MDYTGLSRMVIIIIFLSIRQNAELAKLHQDCIRLNKELVEKKEALQADEQLRKNLESKAAMAEKQLTKLQVRNSPFFAPQTPIIPVV